eukprot:10570959-Ditylum_brightwellii.AAC.1
MTEKILNISSTSDQERILYYNNLDFYKRVIEKDDDDTEKLQFCSSLANPYCEHLGFQYECNIWDPLFQDPYDDIMKA